MKRNLITSLSAYLRRHNYSNIRSAKHIIDHHEIGHSSDKQQDILPDLAAENRGVTYFYKVLTKQSLTVDGLLGFCKSFNEKYQNEPNVKLKLLVPSKKSDALLQWLNQHQFENIGIIRVQNPQLSF